MKIEVKGGIIYSDSKAHADAGGIVPVGMADRIAAANACGNAEGFVAKYAGRSFKLDKEFLISGEIKCKKGKVEEKTRLPGTAKANGKYTFTDQERRDMGMTLAQKHYDRAQIEDEKKSVMSQFKERLDKVALDIGNLSRNVHNGYEFRDFECYVIIDWPAKTKTFFTVDGDTQITVRSLDPSDFQMKMEIDNRAAEDAVKEKKVKKADKEAEKK